MIPLPKIMRTKWTGSVSQALEELLYKCEALSSNSSPTKTRKFSIKYSQTNFNNKFKRSYIIINIDSLQECKNGSA
jgi:hypothetical protein